MAGAPPGFLESNWNKFCASIAQLNKFAKPRLLRKYQSDILNGGAFNLVSPHSGRVVNVVRGIPVSRSIAYLIPGGARAWLIAGHVGLGYPLCNLILPGSRNANYPLIKERPSHKQQIHENDFQSLENSDEFTLPLGNGRVTLVIGHKNFAHHLWNELPALEEWLRSAPAGRLSVLSILATDEPLGPLREIFPRLSTSTFITEAGGQHSNGTPEPSIPVRVGSKVVTKEVRHRIREFAKGHVQAAIAHPAHPLLMSGWPRIWISVRLGWRTADNFDAFLLTVVGDIFDLYPKAVILLDGFSLPFKFFDDPRTVDCRESFAARTAEVGSFIAELKHKARQQLGTEVSSRMCSISGIDLPTAIILGAFCDYYICHCGTLQHKIGWVHDIPGILHGPHSQGSHFENGSAGWHAAQVEGGILPDIIPPEMIVTSDPSSRRKSWNLNYRFACVEQSAAFVIDCLSSHLASENQSVVPT